MTNHSVKSPAQLEYELAKLKNERISLLNNWTKKKEESLARMVTFRAELKEIEAVKAAREESNAAFTALVEPILNLAKTGNLPLPMKPGNLESQRPESPATSSQIINQIGNLTQAAAAVEMRRIISHREEHLARSTYIQGKSKEIYVSLSEEKCRPICHPFTSQDSGIRNSACPSKQSRRSTLRIIIHLL